MWGCFRAEPRHALSCRKRWRRVVQRHDNVRDDLYRWLNALPHVAASWESRLRSYFGDRCQHGHRSHSNAQSIIPSPPTSLLFVMGSKCGKSNLITNLVFGPEYYGDVLEKCTPTVEKDRSTQPFTREEMEEIVTIRSDKTLTTSYRNTYNTSKTTTM